MLRKPLPVTKTDWDWVRITLDRPETMPREVFIELARVLDKMECEKITLWGGERRITFDWDIDLRGDPVGTLIDCFRITFPKLLNYGALPMEIVYLSRAPKEKLLLDLDRSCCETTEK